MRMSLPDSIHTGSPFSEVPIKLYLRKREAGERDGVKEGDASRSDGLDGDYLDAGDLDDDFDDNYPADEILIEDQSPEEHELEDHVPERLASDDDEITDGDEPTEVDHR